MTTLTGILYAPGGGEGRVRQWTDTLRERPDDPVIPRAILDQLPLRHGQEVTVEFNGQLAEATADAPELQHAHHGNHHHRQQQRRRHPHQSSQASGRGPIVTRIVAIEGVDPEAYRTRKAWEETTSIDPQPRLALEYPGCPASCRLIDLFCPIGRGQRGLIVSPPKAGKTTLLKDIAFALAKNHPDLNLFAMLIDERPEEVTDFRRTVPAQVFASSNDHDTARHIAVATTLIDRCKRMAESGKHVVILLDSLTRLGRAFNRSRDHANSGRTMTGGIDSRALTVPKQIFGAARNTEEGGSLTVIATCLVDTGSQGDNVIFEEFKGTGNMELILDRKISERRLFPAINLAASGTRKEHLLMGDAELKTVTALRRRLMNMPPHQQVEQLLAALQRFKSNAELVGT